MVIWWWYNGDLYIYIMDGIDAEYQWYIMPVNDTVYWWDINGIEYNGILMEYLYRE
jgi:hypothetical protein